MSPLNDKQIRFADEYLVDFNATAAAKRAGYSHKTAYSQGHDLLKKPDVQAYLQKKKQKVASKLEVNFERTMLEYARIAYFDPRNLYDEDGALKKVRDMDDDTAAALASIEVDELWEGHGEERKQIGVTKKVKQWSKIAALGVIAEHLGIKKPAPALVNNFNLNNLSTEDIKALQALKQKTA